MVGRTGFGFWDGVGLHDTAKTLILYGVGGSTSVVLHFLLCILKIPLAALESTCIVLIKMEYNGVGVPAP